MASERDTIPRGETNSVEMPRPTAAPLVLSLGAGLLAAGVPFGAPFLFVGALMIISGLGLWVADLLPGEGHYQETLAASAPAATSTRRGVEQLRPGMVGYRAQLPEAVHPTSAGIRGGIIGGMVMPIPALLWGNLSGHGIWYPINLLAGMVLPGVETMSDATLAQFSLTLLVTAVAIHAAMSVVLGLLYGVLLPTLPHMILSGRGATPLAGSLVWGGLIFPTIWSGISYSLMAVVNPLLESRVDWPWFIASQFVFGVTAALVVARSEKIPVPPAGEGSL